MNKIILEYIWLDGYGTPNLRSKTKVMDWPIDDINLSQVPEWNFDGSSTRQAPGSDSECLLRPVRLYKSGHRKIFRLCDARL